MDTSVIWLVALSCIYLGVSTTGQTEAIEEGLVVQIVSEAPDIDQTKIVIEKEEISDVICAVCVCEDRSVDCRNKNVTTPFGMTDWDGVINFAPLSVDFSHNPLKSLTKISNLTTLRYLNASNCEIESIEYATFSYLTDLVSLDLSSNRLLSTSINKRVFLGIIHPDLGIRPHQNIRYLSLANNDIHSLAQDTFTFMTTLTTLDLSGNPLDYIDQITMGAITDLVDLRELNLSGCNLESLPEGMFRRHLRLRRLDLSNNRFAAVPTCLGEALPVEYLNFGRNRIEILNETNPIPKLKNLKELRLNRLPRLRRITDGALSGLTDLEILDLSFNTKLYVLEDQFLSWHDEHTEHETWPPIQEFYLNNNNLSTVYSGYLERWDRLSRVNLGYNPFVCDCHSQWLVDVFVPLVATSESNSTLENMICRNPKEMRGISILHLHYVAKELPCPESENLTDLPVPDMAILLGIMIGIFATFPIVLIVIILWRRGTFARCRSRRIESDSEEETVSFEVRDIKVSK